jgi:PKD repeat protein
MYASDEGIKTGGSSTRNLYYKNNIFLQNRSYTLYLDIAPDALANNHVFQNNLIRKNNSGDVIAHIYGHGASHTLSSLQSNYPVYFSYNIENNPEFEDLNHHNFRLRSDSPCIDNGGFLTRTTTQNNGSQIPVEDAGYFTNGMGVISGDLIQLEGQPQTARITSVDYNNNRITVDKHLSWTMGQGVSLVYSGSSPDIGAYEYSSQTPLNASVDASPTTGLIPLTVSFTGYASGGTPSYSYSWNFGDGGTSTSQNPSHTYSQPGNFNVVLTVTDSASQQDTDNATINVSSQNPNFTLSISSSTGSPAPGSGGTVDPPPGNHGYSSGTNAQIEATPNSNYRFSSWTGDVSDSVMGNTQFTLTMDADKSISAKFCTRCGDINGDLTITPMDAQNIFDIFLGILSDPTLCQRENADVNCDGTPDNPNVTPFDAQSIFNYYLGMADLPGDCSYNTRASSSGLIETMSREFSDVNLLIADPLFLPGGDEILVPVMIDSSIRLESFGFDLVFDTDLFEFAGVARAELTKDFIQVGGNVIEDGVLRVGGYREKTFEDCSPGELVILIFRIKREIEVPVTFTIFKTYDDLKNASVDAGRESLVR